MPRFRVYCADDRNLTIHAPNREEARRKAGARLAVQRPEARIVAITEIDRESNRDRIQRQLRQAGMSRQQAYAELEGEEEAYGRF